MSAFLVSKSHINAMLHFLRATDAEKFNELRIYRDPKPSHSFGLWYDDATWAKAAAALYDENLRSVRHCYSHNVDALTEWAGNVFTLDDLSMPRGATPINPVVALKLCDCFDYQANETDDYRQTVAFALVEMIRGTATATLPGYTDAPWGMDDGAFPARQVARLLITIAPANDGN